ncbi:hypothetical protein ACFE04_001005 [Oxalis oulophora]
MVNIPLKFKRLAAAFDAGSKVAARPCSGDSSGSEHFSLDDSTDLSDLVNIFLEREYYDLSNNRVDEEHDQVVEKLERKTKNHKIIEKEDEEEDYFCFDSENKEMLENLLKDGDDDVIRKKIHAEVELIAASYSSSPEFKRRLMAALRERGFDAGLCKSRWEKFGRHPSGSYDYIDVNHNGVRYIVEVYLAGQFEIARPTHNYSSLLNSFPHIVIAKPDEMKQIVRIMCASIRESMKKMGLHVPPWRRNGYTQAKWFGPYKRTTREFSTKSTSSTDENSKARLSIGFKVFPVMPHRCGAENVVKQAGLRVGQLSAAFNGKHIDV